MIIFGVDPGTVCLGYGVLDVSRQGPRALAFGAVRASRRKDEQYPQRLLRIATGLEEQIRRFPVDVLAVEEAFIGKSVQSALRIGEARGIILLTAAKLDIPVTQYPPATIKKAVVGDGGATKERVAQMVRVTLGLAAIPEPADAADALAIALCHSIRGEHLRRFGLGSR